MICPTVGYQEEDLVTHFWPNQGFPRDIFFISIPFVRKRVVLHIRLILLHIPNKITTDSSRSRSLQQESTCPVSRRLKRYKRNPSSDAVHNLLIEYIRLQGALENILFGWAPEDGRNDWWRGRFTVANDLSFSGCCLYHVRALFATDTIKGRISVNFLRDIL